MIPKKLLEKLIVFSAVVWEAKFIEALTNWHQSVYHLHGNEVGEDNDEDAVDHFVKILSN
ncbi:hypothetical protein QYS48_18775 [Marivirga arenosa]|uniref:Uncharacterized protein n=1 Tax=Marivirga arenosa TaxID=3059076 RepID=A0AA49GKD0_9BACT|nr:hypothetical protein [Marivirga sp. ABR2-2]WKK84224.1 hypothetical protein QYS48_18775 [Marivirga sp. ABR2-2]